MKAKYFLLLLIFLPFGLFAQEDQQTTISGNFLTDQRILTDDGSWAWNENRLTVEINSSLGENADFHSEVWVRNLGLPNFYSFSALYNKNIVQPVSLELRQAYFDVYDFIVPNLDLSVGRQIITWGTADKINPTSNLSPYDYEDLLDFGRKRANDAVKLTYYFNKETNFYLQAVYEPFFRPDNLPVGVFAGIFSVSPDFGIENVTSYSDSLFVPGYELKNFVAGGKLAWNVLNTDFSVSYVYGFNGLPMPSNADIRMVSVMPEEYSLHTNLKYYRQHVIGFDFSTDIAGVGLWGEMATFIPDEDQNFIAKLYTPNPLMPVVTVADSTLLEKKPYFKFVVGSDYHFANGMYLNVQYIHGFLHERGAENLNDYFFMRFEKSFFYDKLKIAPVSGGFIVSDWDDISNNYAYIYMPEVKFMPVGSTEFSVAGAFFGGEGQSLFSNLDKYNMLIFRFKYSF